MEKVVTNAAPSSGGYKDRKRENYKRVFKIRNFKQIVDAHKNKTIQQHHFTMKFHLNKPVTNMFLDDICKSIDVFILLYTLI